MASYSLVAVPNALLSLTLLNVIVFYGEIDCGWQLLAAAAATALAALVSAYLLTSALIFGSSALFPAGSQLASCRSTSLGGPIPMFAQDPGRFVTTTDSDFEEEFLLRPWETVDYLLVPFPTFDTIQRSVVLQTYNDVWNGVLA